MKVVHIDLEAIVNGYWKFTSFDCFEIGGKKLYSERRVIHDREELVRIWNVFRKSEGFKQTIENMDISKDVAVNEIMSDYDSYTNYIDDYYQQVEVEKKNKTIKRLAEEIKNL